jgi:alpha-1,6-mannosyltransferase
VPAGPPQDGPEGAGRRPAGGPPAVRVRPRRCPVEAAARRPAGWSRTVGTRVTGPVRRCPSAGPPPRPAAPARRPGAGSTSQEKTVSTQTIVEPPRTAARADAEAPARDRTTTLLLVGAGLLGLAGATYLAAAGNVLGLSLPRNDLWFFEVTDLAPEQQGRSQAIVLNFAALGVWAVAWLLAGLAVRRGTSVKALMVLGSVWVLPLLVVPPLFSPDMYAYTAIGASVHHGVDPYLAGPGAAGDIPAVRGAEPFWRFSPTPYSPPFIVFLAGLSSLFNEHMLQVLVALRVVAVASWVALAVLTKKLAERCGVDPTRAVWLGIVNPLMLVNGVSAGHNDIVMLVFLVAGILLALADRPLLAVLCCAAGASVKVTALIAVFVIGVDYARRQQGRLAQLKALVLSGLVGGGAFVVAAQLSGYGWGWLDNLSSPGKALIPLSPLTSLAMVLDPVAPPLDEIRSLGVLLGGVICLVLLTRLRRWGLIRVLAWVILTVLAVGPVVWPWYLIVPVLLFAVAGRPQELLFSIMASVALLFTTFPGGEPTLGYLGWPRVFNMSLALFAVLLIWATATNVMSRWRDEKREDERQQLTAGAS